MLAVNVDLIEDLGERAVWPLDTRGPSTLLLRRRGIIDGGKFEVPYWFGLLATRLSNKYTIMKQATGGYAILYALVVSAPTSPDASGILRLEVDTNDPDCQAFLRILVRAWRDEDQRKAMTVACVMGADWATLVTSFGQKLPRRR